MNQTTARLDKFDRPINYLRISVTDRCNLRCLYCMPDEGIETQTHADILRYEEFGLIARAAARLGISKMRVTGGEPLVRLGIVDFIQQLATIAGIDDLSMTTNGILLPRYAHELADAGLRRVNVSLDTLRPERFEFITRRGKLTDTLAGIAAAHEAGLEPLKINMVVIRGLNDDEVTDFARLTLDKAWHIRFIEIMPLGENKYWAGSGYVSTPELKVRIEREIAPLIPAKVHIGNGPARYYQLPDAVGTIGFISPVSEHFCGTCNRLRLTADGKLRPCLLSDYEIDLRTPLRAGASEEEIMNLIVTGITAKPERHRLADCEFPHARGMSEIGG